MGIGLTEEHDELQRSVRGTLDRLGGTSAGRDLCDLPAEQATESFAGFAAEGWLGLGVDELRGGQGGSPADVVILAEELGVTVFPGPAVSTLIAATIMNASSTCDETLLRSLCEGGVSVAVATIGELHGTANGRDLIVSGTLDPVVAATTANVLLSPCRLASGELTTVVIELRDPTVTLDTSRPALDVMRRPISISVNEQEVPASRVLRDVSRGFVEDVTTVYFAAETCGMARASLAAATVHAKDRVQFGRPIGQFQGVKHRLASLLVAVEQLTAAVWDASLALSGATDVERSLSAAVAGALAASVGPRAARDAIQVLGGMGFTYEHDAHMYLRRALTNRQILGGEQKMSRAVTDASIAGIRRKLGVELPADAQAVREELLPIVRAVAEAPDDATRRVVLGESGLMFPHFPKPYGRAASATEQLVIEELFAEFGVRRPPAHVASWALPTIISHGSIEQQERFVTPTLRGEILWCQLFSEPGAGSDLAALSTKATKVDGGWRIDGQKVWTSTAQWAQYGILLARSNPDAPKHQGITYFILDMKAENVDIRPLREITGDSLFNEVFLDGVFIPDDCVVGEIDGGWNLARTTLANERVALASSSAFSGLLEQVVAIAAAAKEQGLVLDRSSDVGALLVEAQSLALMRQRQTIRSLNGLAPGGEASLAKLLGAEHEQRVADLALSVLEGESVYADGVAAGAARNVLHTLCLTIAGGTSEVQRNVIGERLLGLPRDPEPTNKPA